MPCRPGAHLSGCSPGRPRCRAHRAKNRKWKICRCDWYPFPHRKGSGLCGNQTKQWERLYGPQST